MTITSPHRSVQRTFMDSHPTISFIIPAYNERQHLPHTLDAIKNHMPHHIAHEIIVVDHGSEDGTPQLAEAWGARVLHQRGGTIGGLRNRGVAVARGDIIVFLDADVRLTADWGRRIGSVLTILAERPHLLTGSYSDIPESAGWLQRSWFGPQVSVPAGDYLPTQHLILSRADFELVGGFDEVLETGEDYEFSRRASAFGFTIAPDPELRVIHDGFPNDVRSFVRREIWHGRGDFATFSNTLRSKVALAAIIFLILHLILFSSLAFLRIDLAAFSFGAVIVLTFLGSFQRFRHAGLRRMLMNLPLLYLYLAGRALSWMQVLWRPHAIKRTRESSVSS